MGSLLVVPCDWRRGSSVGPLLLVRQGVHADRHDGKTLGRTGSPRGSPPLHRDSRSVEGADIAVSRFHQLRDAVLERIGRTAKSEFCEVSLVHGP